jgi:hypothetical protein
MAIEFNSNRIGTSSTGTGSANRRRQPSGQNGILGDVIVPKRADVNYIPGPESLQTLISSAVESMRRGVAWDRGTILNLLL